MIVTTRYELEQEIKSRETIIRQCQELIDRNNILIKEKWAEIKDFVDGNSSEKVKMGGDFILARKKEIRERQVEIGRKNNQIADLKAKLNFKDKY
jgi:hypothetical protein